MKAVALCGSPRKGGNTESLLRRCLAGLEKEGIAGQLVRVGGRPIKPCTACAACVKNQDKACVLKDGDFDEIFALMLDADIIVVGSPVYFGSATPEIMALLHRAGYVSRANGNLFSRRLGAAVSVARRAGQNFTFAQLLYWFLINDMIVPGSTYWNVGIGRAPGDVETDDEGLATIDRLAENLAWLAGKTG